ncbi:hypothetical protein PVK06_027111 [Gossypium arboreum]|uniref:C2H2-type domain-containing protein n=1 Tax=Gossypium arboreum TaxID=29729 RepID=A0ABR0NZE4_GOSAR|nr:hypothetical protein PVK06_027111 [Gossypium arboreum]
MNAAAFRHFGICRSTVCVQCVYTPGALKRHTKFHSPLSHSSELVSRAFCQFLATFTFNPIHRLRALYAQSFRRTLAPRLTTAAGTELAGASSSSPVMIAHSTKELYERALPFFTHAILLDRAFAHCPRFPTAAPRGSPGRVSVPVWLIIRKVRERRNRYQENRLKEQTSYIRIRRSRGSSDGTEGLQPKRYSAFEICMVKGVIQHK